MSITDNEAATLSLLGGFQLIEEALRIYITSCFDLIRECVEGKVPFKYLSEDIETYPLERLLNLFVKYSDNKELCDRLNKLRPHRNHVAHRSMLEILGVRDTETKHNADELLDIQKEALVCLALLVREIALIKDIKKLHT